MDIKDRSFGLDERRYDIDWLRSLAFILLIFYHIGMYYVFDWGWHIKSQYQSEFLQNIMIMVNRWRMPLIFLISGIALSLVEHKITAANLLKMRFTRVFIPLVIGMYLIVPPQLYAELVQNEGFQGSYWTFWQFYIDPNTAQYPNYNNGPLGLLTWNHLWYLAYLWHYTLIFVLFKFAFDYSREFFSKINLPIGILFILVVSYLCAIGMWLRPLFPTTHALVDDWYKHALYFSIFIFGYLLAKSPTVWSAIIRQRRTWFYIAVVGYACTLLLHEGRIGTLLAAWGVDTKQVGSMLMTRVIINWIIYANMLSWLFLVVGYAGKYLNKPSRLLSYMNDAVLPWYILHQSVTIMIAMWLYQFQLGPVVEPILVTLFTFLSCAIGYELIKRNTITRFAFGLKLAKDRVKSKDSLVKTKKVLIH